MATKVTSLCSTSGAPTTPNATPRTEASVSTDNIPHTDLNAVGRILGTVQEDLNESADAAMYPSPPINTPEAFSPAPSVYRPARGRGLSAIGDRLAQLKLEERISPRKDTDVTSSNRSVVASIEEDDKDEQDDDGASSGKYSPAQSPCPAKPSVSFFNPTPVSIPIALGSPSSNPRIQEYLSFTSNDLPVTGPNKPDTSSTLAAPAMHSRENSIKSVKSDGAVSGVTEKSTWAEEVEDAAKRTVLQLEQLAMDEYNVDASKTIDDYYIARWQRLLSAPDRQIKVTVSKKTKDEE
ncbi:hypothetical protein K458DRAFT_294007 [Lentithecium fluviatile CBS 122367]|uniref:Uncharacterized protein n=1 Tax=Lentithecium fluviatile CBS 122367 TaxID=1168545 RepID=A0A6G1JBE7_9PLEO|nr:hypothetical protein K458DRAFT_294007 [Lentithecium fluviatile CBS 122367]